MPDPDEVLTVMDVPGYCKHCKQRGTARLVAYGSGEILIRCAKCKFAGEFIPDDSTNNDPNKFKPFKNDEDSGGQY